MRVASRSLSLILSVLLASAAGPSTAAAAPSADKLLDRAKSYEASLTSDPAKVKMRHNVERLIGLWSSARAKAKGDDKREAMEGELRAWKLLAKWSGKASDKEKVAALADDLRDLSDKRDAGPAAKADPKPARAKDKPKAKQNDAKGAKGAREGQTEVAAKDDDEARDAKAERSSEKPTATTAAELLKVVDDVRRAFPELAHRDAKDDDADDDRDDAAEPEPSRPSREHGAQAALQPADDEDPAQASDYEDGDEEGAEVVLAKGGAIKVASRLKRSTREASKPRSTSVVRIRRVVVDAGHGGKDFGAIAKNGLREKDVNLAIALELGRQLEKRLGVRVTYTRDADEFVSLRRRSQIANASDADLFISVHANAHKKRSISGVETYYLNTTSDRYAERLAKRENGDEDDEEGGDAPEPTVGMTEEAAALPNGALGRDLRLILADLAMRSATIESRRLAGYVQSTVVGKLKRKYDDVEDLGVKHALFFVLLGVRMPSILVETGFVTNPTEGARLADPKYRNEVAGAIAHGVVRFVLEREAIARKLDGKAGDETLASSVRR